MELALATASSDLEDGFRLWPVFRRRRTCGYGGLPRCQFHDRGSASFVPRSASLLDDLCSLHARGTDPPPLRAGPPGLGGLGGCLVVRRLLGGAAGRDRLRGGEPEADRDLVDDDLVAADLLASARAVGELELALDEASGEQDASALGEALRCS
jgi:hypothetical protein